MNILVDSSVWINYFRTGTNAGQLDSFIEQNLICTNSLILSELIPSLKIKKHAKVIKLMREIHNIPLAIDWEMIIEYQIKCLRNGVNKIGIPDLIILDNVIQNSLTLFTNDNHFALIQKFVKFKLLTF